MLIKRLLPALLFMLVINFGLSSQIGEYYIGDARDEKIHSVLQLDQEKFIIAQSIDQQIAISKVDDKRNFLWSKKLNRILINSYEEFPNKIVKDNQNYVIIGSIRKTNSIFSNVGFIAVLDSNGNLLKSSVFENLMSLSDIIVSNNSYYIAGLAGSVGSGTTGFICKLDSSLNTSWIQYRDYYGNTWIKRLFLSRENELICIGRTNSIGRSFSGLSIEKLDTNSNLIWRKYYHLDFSEIDTYLENNFEFPLGAVIKDNGKIIIAESYGWSSQSVSRAIKLLEVDILDGTILNSKIYYNNYTGENPYEIFCNKRGEFVITGSVNERLIQNQTYNTQSFLLILDSLGLKKSKSFFGNNGFDNKLFQTIETQTGYLSLGYSNGSPNDTLNCNNYLVQSDYNAKIYPNNLKISIVIDENLNCKSDHFEKFAKDFLIEIKGEKEYIEFSKTEPIDLNLKFGTYQVSISPINKNSSWEVCEDSLYINVDSLLKEIVFLVKPRRSESNFVSIDLSIPEVIKCKTSRLTMTLRNDNILPSKEFLVELGFDTEIEFIESDFSYSKLDDKLILSIPSIQGLDKVNGKVNFRTACSTQLGSAHRICAKILDTASGFNVKVPYFKANNHCTGEEAIFNVYAENRELNSEYEVHYNVYWNQFLYYSSTANDRPLIIPKDVDTLKLKYPSSKGGTWRLELFQQDSFPYQQIYSSTIESCGSNNTGSHYIGFRNDRSVVNNPIEKEILVKNTSNVADCIVAHVRGRGYYNLIDNFDKQEFSVRIYNKYSETIKNIKVELKFSNTYDLLSFHILSNAYEYELEFSLPNRISLLFKDVNLLNSMDSLGLFEFSFSISPIQNLNSSEDHHFDIFSSFFLDNYGPYNINPVFNNYSLKVNQNYDTLKTYKDIVELYTDNYTIIRETFIIGDFVYLFLDSRSYSCNNSFELLLMKLNAKNELIGITPILEYDSETYLSDIVAYDISSIMIAVNSAGFVILRKIDLNGSTIWEKRVLPGKNNEQGRTGGISILSSGNIVLFGNLNIYMNPVFYFKLSSEGEIISKTQFNFGYFVSKVSGIGNNRLLISCYNPNSFPVRNQPYTYLVDSSGILIKGGIVRRVNYETNVYNTFTGENGNCIILGESYGDLDTNITFYSPFIMKYDSAGNLLVNKRIFIDTLYSAYFFSGVYDHTLNKYYLVGACRQNTIKKDDDLLVCQLDVSGKLLWWTTFGNSNSEGGRTINISGDSVLLFGNSGENEPNYSYQPILLVLNKNGKIVNTSIPINESSLQKIKIWPIPAKSKFNYELPIEINRKVKWELLSLTGQFIKSGFFISKTGSIDVVDLPSGTYLLYCNELNSYSSKIIIE